jgi:ketopantoate reductase
MKRCEQNTLGAVLQCNVYRQKHALDASEVAARSLTEIKAVRAFDKAHTNKRFTASVLDADHEVTGRVEYGFDTRLGRIVRSLCED